ncbi:MAG: hypothetical protein M1830_002019, partial [Pleopsidium flavum]
MTAHPVFKVGNTALITGAASGIGLAVAQLCKKHGMKLALVDNNTQLLSEAKNQLSGDTETYPVDVSKIEEWRELREKVGKVDFLMLNAGIGVKGGWDDIEYFHKIMDTNLFGVLNGLSTYLPNLRNTPTPTAVIITGSKQGITNPPGNPAYNASKAALKTLAEHLSYDLRSTPTSVHLLVPGWTFTGLSGGEPGSKKTKPEGAWTPEQVTGFLEEKMGEGRFYVVCPDGDTSEEVDRKRMLWG